MWPMELSHLALESMWEEMRSAANVNMTKQSLSTATAG